MSSEPDQQSRWPNISHVRPLSVPMMLRDPRLVEASPLLRHIPVLLWVIEISRPRRVVQVGMDDAVAFLAVCQALEKAAPDAECDGIGINAILPATAERLHLQIQSFHPRLVRLEGRSASEWAEDAVSKSIDLLFLDLNATDGLDGLNVDWARLMSPRGVVLIHGGAALPAAPPAVEQLAADRPTIHLEECGGLQVILYGPEQAADLTRVAALPPSSPIRLELGTRVSRLCSMTWAEVATEALRHLETLQQRLQEAEAELSPLREENAALRTRHDAHRVVHDARTMAIADVQAGPADAGTEFERLTTSAAETLRRQAQALARRDSALAAAHDRMELLTREIDELRAQASRKDEEIVALTRRLGRLMASTSWKVTAPARSLLRFLRPRR